MTNFNDIAGYHSRFAAHHLTLAKEARDAGNSRDAEYQTQLAARYQQASHEQRIAMSKEPGVQAANQRSNGWSKRHRPMEQPARPFLAVWLLAILRGINCIAAAIRKAMPKRDAPIEGLSLRG